MQQLRTRVFSTLEKLSMECTTLHSHFSNSYATALTSSSRNVSAMASLNQFSYMQTSNLQILLPQRSAFSTYDGLSKSHRIPFHKLNSTFLIPSTTHHSKRKLNYSTVFAKKDSSGKSVEGGQYKNSVNLPLTNFSMRANAVTREPEIQKLWNDKNVVKKLQQTNNGKIFTLHDGPPYANGDLHIGHALNKILKDFINRYQILQGKRVHYIPGWDCHGLPIELKVLQSMDSESRKNLTPIKLRKKAAKFALETVKKQKTSFQRYGVWGEWDEPYLTLSPEYEKSQIDVFAEMYFKGNIYRGLKPVHWSPSSKTALAEAELEYPEGHVSRSIYTAFKITKLSENMANNKFEPFLPSLGLLIWTTTPWTMFGNAAVAINDQLTYAIVEVSKKALEEGDEVLKSEGKEKEAMEKSFGKGKRNEGKGLDGNEFKYIIVAEDLIENLSNKFNCLLTVKETFPGSVLEKCMYKHPLKDRESPVVIGGDYITTASGSGLVHTAPGHGQEDYQTGMKYNLPLLSPVDNEGNFTEEAGLEFKGLSVLGEGNVAVIKALDEANSLFLEEGYEHKYPYDWRTKKPTIFRATEQWFASVEGFRKEALDAISTVRWFPPQGENRIKSMTESRSDWCISRQRTWGVPIPVFFHIETGKPLITKETIAHIRLIVAEKGSDAWFQMEVSELLPENLKNDAHLYTKGLDTMDVWFDSGSSWATVISNKVNVKFPADIYLEGSDQHRGWFQSSLLTCVATKGIAPYSTVITHGFVLDERGYKMSKSLGNVVNPTLVIDGGKNQKENPPYGADILRLWVASVDYTGDVLIGPQILRQLSDIYRKIRGTLRYLLGNLHDFKPTENTVPYEQLDSLDKYALYKLASVVDEIKESYENYQFYRFFQIIQRYVVVDLSNFYFDACKDRLYVGGVNGFPRRSCQTVLSQILSSITRSIAPVLPHMAEDAWQNLPYPFHAEVGKIEGKQNGSSLSEAELAETVFEARWPSLPDTWRNLHTDEIQLWTKLLLVRSEANKVLELARTGKLIGANLDAKAHIFVADEWLSNKMKEMEEKNSNQLSVDKLRYLLITSQVEVVESMEKAKELNLQYSATSNLEGLGEVWVGVSRAEGDKCERCWNYSIQVGDYKDHPTLCERCHPIIIDLTQNKEENLATV